MVASVPHRRFGPSGMIVPSWGCGRRRPLARWGANSPWSRISRNTRFPPTPMPCWRRSRARTLRYPSPANGESAITRTRRPAKRRVEGVATAGTHRLWGRDREIGELAALIDRARSGRSGCAVGSGEAGAGKRALVDAVAPTAAPQRARNGIVATESEMEVAYAGLELLCGPRMGEFHCRLRCHDPI